MMLCCETDAWNMWWMKLVKNLRPSAGGTCWCVREKYDQCIVEAVQIYFCVFSIFADMLRMLQDVMPEMWNVTMKSQTMQWVVHAGANKRKMTNGSWKMRRFICCIFCFVFWHVPCACCETVFMWTERDAKRDALTSVAWKRCKNKCMNTESARGRAWKNMWVRNSAESHTMSDTPGMLLRDAALEKLRAKRHEDDTLIA